jgi:diguanylate cyclase (GGDEF)-like protein
VFLDLDLLQQVTATHGHDCGDALLQDLAEGMLQMCRQSDLVTRLAGDEFVLLLPETVLEQAQGLLERISAKFVEQPMSWMEEKISIQLSFGISSVLEVEVESAQALFKLADERLYQKKQQRKSDV